MVLSDLLIVLLLWAGMAVFLKEFERYSAPPCSWDNCILSNTFKCRRFWLNRFCLAITHLGSFFVLAPAVLLISWELNKAGKTGSAWLLASSFIGASLIAHLGKRIFKRRRPDLFPALGRHFKDPSYPSAHSAQVVAFVAPLWHIFNTPETHGIYFITVAALILVSMVAFSRIYLQVHYPSDVFAGIFLAVFWFSGIRFFSAFIGIGAS